MGTRALFAAAVLVGGVVFANHALAFTVDEKSGANADGSPRYVDPDEQPLPFPFLVKKRPPDASQYQGDDSQVDPRPGQWLSLPDWFFPSPPRR